MRLKLVHTIEYVLKGLGWSRSLLSLQSKSCLMIILVFMIKEDNYFTREAEIINDIVHVYDLDKDWFRIFTLERDIY